MNNSRAFNKITQSSPFWFVALWSLILLANFVPLFPQPQIIIGYLWKVEFALATLLFLSIVLAIKYSKEKILIQFNKQEFWWIILPLILFTVWSGFSCFWAESRRPALHHTLLWACYLTFYFLIRQIISRPRVINISLVITGFVVLTLGLACLIEYFLTPIEISVNISLRYSKYAENLATLLPIFIALAINKKNSHSTFWGTVVVIGWLGIIFSLGRTQFLAALTGILAFTVFAFLKSKQEISPKKTFLLFSLLVLLVIFSQFPAMFGYSQQTTLKRFSSDEQSQASFQVRLLFWEIALESFKQSPVSGVGADNFAINYENARRSHAEANPENPQTSLYENYLPERTHNEYLQVLSELGVVGIFIFGWLLFGILRFAFSLRKKSVTLLSIASFAGIAAFLVSSIASSYSFRVPANGLCFFFLLALLVQSSKFKVQSSKSNSLLNLKLETWNLKPIVAAFGVIICSAMMIFSAMRGASLMYLQMAFEAKEKSEAENYYRKAIALDDQDGAINYYYGLHLVDAKDADKGVSHLRFGIDEGVATSAAYFRLYTAQTSAFRREDAERTLLESLRVYPRSVFLRTAYAAHLKEKGESERAQIELEKARRINAAQAESWWLAQTEGMQKLSENGNEKLVKVMDLQPAEGIYAVIEFQRQFKPNLVWR